MNETTTTAAKKAASKKKPGQPTQQERLITVLYSLEELIGRQTSLKFAFMRGAVYGLGTVIGATLLLALFGGILAATIDSLSQLPFIGNYVNQEIVNDIE